MTREWPLDLSGTKNGVLTVNVHGLYMSCHDSGRVALLNRLFSGVFRGGVMARGFLLVSVCGRGVGIGKETLHAATVGDLWADVVERL